MLTRWLTITALLVGSASHGGAAALTPAPACRVKGHPEAELTLQCGDGRRAGVVQFWHTPFGDLHSPGLHSELDPVFMHHDGSLVIPNTSSLHSGLYYCLLQHSEGTTLWPYKLHVGPSVLDQQQHSSCAAFRVRREVAGSEAGLSGRQFAGAVAASVVVTFVVGFSVGALARSHVLRCLAAVTTKLKSPQQRQNHPDEPDQTGSEVVMTTLPPTCDNQATFEREQVTPDDDDSAVCAMETTVSSTTPSPPAKPQRSFRRERAGQQEATAYLEGRGSVEQEEGGRVEEKNEGCDEEGEFSGFHLSEDGGSKTETDENVEEEDEKKEEDEKVDQKEEEDEKMEEVEERMDEETGEAAGEENQEGHICREPEQSSDSADDDNWDRQNQAGTLKSSITEAPPPPSAPCTRVIRLYQYDEDGQRYRHLPAPDEPGPAPRLKHRSRSLTRLSAIMAAASGSPLENREAGKEAKDFNMQI